MICFTLHRCTADCHLNKNERVTFVFSLPCLKSKEALYDEAKEREAEAKKARDAEIERLKADDAAYKAQKKAEKLAKKGKK